MIREDDHKVSYQKKVVYKYSPWMYILPICNMFCIIFMAMNVFGGKVMMVDTKYENGVKIVVINDHVMFKNKADFGNVKINDIFSEKASINTLTSENAKINKIEGNSFKANKLSVININGNSLDFKSGSFNILTSEDKVTCNKISVNSITGNRLEFNEIKSESGSINALSSGKTSVNELDTVLITYGGKVNSLNGVIKFEDDKKVVHTKNNKLYSGYFLNKNLINKGVYNIRYIYKGLGNLDIGVATLEYKKRITSNQTEKCEINILSDHSTLSGLCGEKIVKGKIDLKLEYNCVYELIVDMDERTMKIRINGGIELGLYKNIKPYLIPYVKLYNEGDEVIIDEKSNYEI